MSERVDYFTVHRGSCKKLNVVISDEFGMVKLEDDNTGISIEIDIVAALRVADFIKGGKN